MTQLCKYVSIHSSVLSVSSKVAQEVALPVLFHREMLVYISQNPSGTDLQKAFIDYLLCARHHEVA